MLEDVTIDTMQSALRGLSARQSAISNDIANVNTPYYRARNVQFEGQLRSALENGENPLTVQPSTQFSTAESGLAGITGNNVDLNAETVASVQTELSYQLALRATGDRFTLLRTAIKGA